MKLCPCMVIPGLGLLGLGALAYWYAKPLGERLKEGDTALVSEVFVSKSGAAVQSFPGRRFVVEVLDTDPQNLRGKVVGIEGAPPENGAQSFLNMLGSVLNSTVYFTSEAVTAAERQGRQLSGSTGPRLTTQVG